MLHRVSLETSAEGNKSLEAIYSNSWIQAKKKENRQIKKTLGSSQRDLGHVDPLEVQAICSLEAWPFQGSRCSCLMTKTNLALPRMLVLAAMAKLRGMELPTTERTGAGATSVVHQAGSVTIKFCLLPYFQNNLLYVCRQENSMQLQSLFCHLRLSFLGTILDLWGLPLLEGCWNRRLSFKFLYVMVSLQGGAKGGNFFSPP